MTTHFKNINGSLKEIDLTLPNNYNIEMEEYLRFYGLDFGTKEIEHYFTMFESGGLRLAAHVYKPIDYKATFFLLHGYYNHCGLLSHMIDHLLNNGYAVALFDLPGHGLSQGARCEIDDFSQYALALKDFQRTVKTLP